MMRQRIHLLCYKPKCNESNQNMVQCILNILIMKWINGIEHTTIGMNRVYSATTGAAIKAFHRYFTITSQEEIFYFMVIHSLL